MEGYFAADGNAGQTGAAAGNKWVARFAPPLSGTWTYAVYFKRSTMLAAANVPDPALMQGTAVPGNGRTGTFSVAPTQDAIYMRGRLERNGGDRYYHWSDTGRLHIKAGFGSPENFLGYAEFDNTLDHGGAATPGLTNGLHQYLSHVRDWRVGDPTWKNGSGKGIIGMINYAADVGLNSMYLLMMNVEGDGQEVYPWTSYTERRRFDVSKLEQWAMVLTHAGSRGIGLTVMTQERENDAFNVFGSRGLNTVRKLYYREIVARFAHHPNVDWCMGEESTRSPSEILADMTYFKQIDPYRNRVSVHNWPFQPHTLLQGLLGSSIVDGPALQVTPPEEVHDTVLKWVLDSKNRGHQWVVNMDESGPPTHGIVPDSDDPNHNTERRVVLWGTLMAGGAGMSSYFGYQFPHTDLTCEDWRSRENWNRQMKIARDVLEPLPLNSLEPLDGLVSGTSDVWAMTDRRSIVVVYVPFATSNIRLNLSGMAGSFSLQWYNLRNGGGVRPGPSITGGSTRSLPAAPGGGDWVAVARTTDCAADVCGIACGDGTSCRDCTSVPNGPAQLDACGICNGDGTSCNGGGGGGDTGGGSTGGDAGDRTGGGSGGSGTIVCTGDVYYVEELGRIVLNLRRFSIAGQWSLRGSVSGSYSSQYYEWRSGDPSTTISAAGSSAIRANVLVSLPGVYEVRLRSNTPALYDHNDVWFRAQGSGSSVLLRKARSEREVGNAWTKVYQNIYMNTWSWGHVLRGWRPPRRVRSCPVPRDGVA